MKHRTYSHKEEEHHLHEEFVREAYRGCKALRDVQRAISESLGEYIHISNIALAYEDLYEPTDENNDRAVILDKVKLTLLLNPKHISAIDEARAAVHHSNFHCGLHRC